VVSDIPGNRDWISHERNGLLFPPGDAIALASCLTRALADSELRLFARRINAGIIRERAVWDSNMGRVEEAFIGLVQPDAFS
jgi:glycosyltransferase involved in cell wall biosynthesis